ncbi:MAG TPA: HlyD family efflux transporter periplasmic adaptor subunit [Kofleriaceae bacterium]
MAAAALVAGCRSGEKHPGTYQGIVELEERVLGFEVGGRLREVAVDEGDAVAADQLLAAMDDRLERTARDATAHQASAARAQAQLVRAGARSEEIRAQVAGVEAARAAEDLATTNLDREQKLLAAEATTRAAVDQLAGRKRAATAERRAAEQKLRALREGARSQEVAGADARAGAAAASESLATQRVDLYHLRAPAAGVVLDVVAEPGEVVAPGAPVVVIADPAHPFADVFVPQAEVARVRLGQAARIEVDGDPQPLSGRVEHIARRAEFTPRFVFSEKERPNLVVRVRVRIADPQQRLHAGVPAFVALDGAAR